MNDNVATENFAAWMRVFQENSRRFPIEELRKYAGKCIAWSRMGDRIVASADDYDTLLQRVREAGHDPYSCPWDFVED